MSEERGTRPHVRLRLPDGREVAVGPGGLIGRARTAALRLDDPRASEAQAMVSLRGRRLWLLALRGQLRTRGGPVSEIPLHPGMRVQLSPSLEVQVAAVVLPERTLALTGLGPAPRELLASVHCVLLEPEPALVEGFRPEAPAVIWSTAEGWRVQVADREPEELLEGSRFVVGGVEIRVIGVPLGQVATAPTRGRFETRSPLKIVLRQETVHVHREGQPVAVLQGMAARILSEVARFEAPTPWDWVAREIWDVEDREVLRQRWDRNLRTLRSKLRQLGLPGDLARADGHGNIELVLKRGDEVIDEG